MGDRANTNIQDMDPEDNSKGKQRAMEVLEVEDEEQRQERMRKSLVQISLCIHKDQEVIQMSFYLG